MSKNPKNRHFFNVSGGGQRGNFLLQALLAIALVVAFMPFLARRMALQTKNAEMVATTTQVNRAGDAARLYVRENNHNIPYGVTVVSGDDFSDLLEPYGLPLGFIPQTPFGDDISLVLLKKGGAVVGLLRLSGGGLSELQKREMAARIGFWAGMPESTTTLRAADSEWVVDLAGFGYAADPTAVYVRVPENQDFTELVRRQEHDGDLNRFLTNLVMSGFSIQGGGNILAQLGEFNTAQADTLTLTGQEDGRKLKNKFGLLTGGGATFQGGDAQSALAVTRGVLTAESLSARTISQFGDSGNLAAEVVSVYDYAMAAGRTGFNGPAIWDVGGAVVLENIALNVERLEISSFINATRGQDVFIDETDLTVSAKSGIETGVIQATNITVRDQISSALADGQTGPVLLDVRVAGTSVLPDIWVTGISNGDLMIIADPADNTGDTVDCRSVISSAASRAAASITYNQASLMQNIICRYVFWQRLERRIDIKKCLQEGGADCR